MKNEKKQNVLEKKISRRKYIIAVICFLFLVIAALAIEALRWERKSDPECEAIIRRLVAFQIHKDPNELIDEDFAQITNFKFLENNPAITSRSTGMTPPYFYKEFSDIKFLEKFTNMESLNLNSIKYPEKKIPKWMKFLGKHGVLDLEERFAIDLSPLENMSSLKYLYMGHAKVSDLTPLKNIVSLENLYLQCTLVTDLEPLRGMKNLRFLSISDTKVSSLEPIMHLEKLERLSMANCPNITDKQLDDLRAANPGINISTEEIL